MSDESDEIDHCFRFFHWYSLKYETVLKEVEEGNERAKTILAWLLLSGLGGAKVDEDRAVSLLEERVKDQDSDAMWILGICYAYGLGIEQSVSQAESLYRRSRKEKNETGELLSLGDGDHEIGQSNCYSTPYARGQNDMWMYSL